MRQAVDPLRVLIVDDEEQIRTILQRWIHKWGYEVEAVGSAAEAIAIMERQPAAIVIIDLLMPVLDGLWLLERLTARWPAAAVVIESGALETETVQRTQQFGAADFLAKPFGREQVHQALQRAVARLQR